MKISKPYCESDIPNQNLEKKIGYDLRCTRSSSDKEFFGRTDRVNNNLPALSIEGAGITISVFLLKNVYSIYIQKSVFLTQTFYFNLDFDKLNQLHVFVLSNVERLGFV